MIHSTPAAAGQPADPGHAADNAIQRTLQHLASARQLRKTTPPQRYAVPDEVTALPRPRLVSTNLQRARGTWVRLCPQWWFTGIAANQTSVEARRSGLRA